MKNGALIVGVSKKEPEVLSINIPDGIDLEDAEEGDVIERVVSIKLGSGRKGVIESIEGIPLGEEDDIIETEEDEIGEADSLADMGSTIKKSIGLPLDV